MADLGDHAFSLALTVLGDRAAATDVALGAVRRGGRSRVAVLAFSRFFALRQAGHGAGIGPTSSTPPANVVEVATALAATRPALERAIADVAGRHDLDRVRVGRVLGVPPGVAGDRAAAIAEAWAHDLDPALLAWLGPGDCEELAAILAGVDTPSVDGLLAAGPAVASHISGCEACTDRMRSMVSVHALVTTRPLDPAPPALQAAARRSRFRPPAPLPPPIEPVGRHRWRRAVLIGAVAALVLAGAAVTVALAPRSPTRKERVAVLTRVPGTGAVLTVSPAVVRAAGGAVLVRNTSDRPVRWQASSTASWLLVLPAEGVLAPSGVVELSTQVLSTAPEGDLQAPVTVTGDDGSVAAAVVETTVEHPPTLEASVDGCSVKATAEDESAVGSVVLHWRDGRKAEQAITMAPGPAPAIYLGTIPSRAQPTTWWVAAVDSRGNRTQTPEEPVSTC